MTLSNGHSSSVNALALSEDGRLLASGGDDGFVCLWDPEQRGLRARLRCRAEALSSSSASSFAAEDTGAAISALAFAETAWQQSPYRLFAAQGGHLVAWDVRAHPREPLYRVRVTDDEVNSVALLTSSSSGSRLGASGERRVATADDAGCLRIYDADTGELLRSLRKHDSIASSVLFRPGKDWQVISGGMDCRLIVTDWKSPRGQALNIFDISEILDSDMCDGAAAGSGAAPPLIHCLAATSDGRFVAAGLENGSVELFNSAGRHIQHVESLYGHTAGVSALLCLPGGLLLSGGNDADCFLWNLDSDWSGSSFAHSDKVNALCGVSPDRCYLADSGSAVHCCDLNVTQLSGARSELLSDSIVHAATARPPPPPQVLNEFDNDDDDDEVGNHDDSAADEDAEDDDEDEDEGQSVFARVSVILAAAAAAETRRFRRQEEGDGNEDLPTGGNWTQSL